MRKNQVGFDGPVKIDDTLIETQSRVDKNMNFPAINSG